MREVVWCGLVGRVESVEGEVTVPDYPVVGHQDACYGAEKEGVAA